MNIVQPHKSVGERDAIFDRSAQRVGLLKNFSNQMMRKLTCFSHSPPYIFPLVNSSVDTGLAPSLFAAKTRQAQSLDSGSSGALHAANKSSQHFALRAQHHEVRVRSNPEITFIRDSRHPRR